MANLTFNNETFVVNHAVKGADYIHGYNADGRMVACIEGIVNFDAISYDGEYMTPSACIEEACNDATYINGTLKTKSGATIPANYAGIAHISGNYTLQPADSGKFFYVSAAATITIPDGESVVFPYGAEIEFCSWTSDTVTFAGASGVTLVSLDNLKSIAGQYGCVAMKKLNTNLWLLSGALS